MRYMFFSKSDCPLLNITNIGYAADPTVTRFGPGQRDVYLIHYVLSGKGWFNGQPLIAGQGFLITPGMPEEYHPDPEDPWEYIWFISPDQKMRELLEYYRADPETHIFHYYFIHTLQALRDTLISNKNAMYGSYEMLEIFLNVFKYQQQDALSKSHVPSASIYLEAAEKYICANLHRPIPVSELTGILGISQPYLFKIFKAQFGESPKQYILNQKLIRAQKLLLETDMSVTYIANSVGFPDVLSFSKYFRTKLGLSPQNFRNQKLP